jgi:hypothetical protein
MLSSSSMVCCISQLNKFVRAVAPGLHEKRHCIIANRLTFDYFRRGPRGLWLHSPRLHKVESTAKGLHFHPCQRLIVSILFTRTCRAPTRIHDQHRPLRERPRSSLRLDVLHLAPQPLDLKLLRLHVTLAGNHNCGSASNDFIGCAAGSDVDQDAGRLCDDHPDEPPRKCMPGSNRGREFCSSAARNPTPSALPSDKYRRVNVGRRRSTHDGGTRSGQ